MIINKERETDRVIIFLHLPKSGGNTFYNILSRQRQYDPEACIWKLCSMEDLTADEQKRIEVIFGHMLFGVHRQLPQTSFTYITFLRNPVDRIISLYYYLRSENNPDIEVRDWFNKISLYEFVSDDKFNRFDELFPGSWVCGTENLQTRMLSGMMDEDLAEAKNNLKNYFSVTGITERYDETLKVFQKKFGWEVGSYEKMNITPDKPDPEKIPDEIIRLIKRKNRKDAILYKYANRLLDERLREV